jgi:uncharacterized protein
MTAHPAMMAFDEASVRGAVTDSVLTLALDRDSVRSLDKDGRLHVAVTNLSKATVNPYKGSEIPGWEELGLDPDKIYQMLRDPEELRKAASTFNGVQLLRKHIPISVDDHQPWDVVGTTGTDAIYEDPYLKNSLHVWTQAAIDDIDSEDKRELSCGYHYRPEMTPGNFGAMPYDGVMRDIVGNHVALVKDGRAGPDVVVGDSKENLMTKPTRLAAMTLGLAAASIAPLLAMDSKVTLPKELFKNFTTKTFAESKAKLLAGARIALDGKLRKGLAMDASMEGLAKAIDTFADMPEAMDEPMKEEPAKKMEMDAEIEPVKEEPEKKAYDAEPMKAFLKEKGMADDDIAKVCDMLPKTAMDAEETDEERAAKAAKAKEAEDKKALDAEGKKDMVTKPAMDAALRANAESVTKAVRATEQGIRVALEKVRPYVGQLPATIAFDSGAEVIRHALTMLGREGAKTLHADALEDVLKTYPKAGERKSAIAADGEIAMDSATVDGFTKMFPGSERITTG